MRGVGNWLMAIFLIAIFVLVIFSINSEIVLLAPKTDKSNEKGSEYDIIDGGEYNDPQSSLYFGCLDPDGDDPIFPNCITLYDDIQCEEKPIDIVADYCLDEDTLIERICKKRSGLTFVSCSPGQCCQGSDREVEHDCTQVCKKACENGELVEVLESGKSGGVVKDCDKPKGICFTGNICEATTKYGLRRERPRYCRCKFDGITAVPKGY